MLDKERNTSLSKEIYDKYNAMMPSGLTMYITKEAFGLHYKHPDNDPRANTGIQVGFNLSAAELDKEADDACEAMHRLAKATNGKHGIENQKSNSVIECEKTMVDGKCQCGYSAKASETAASMRNVVKVTEHTGSGLKVLKSRLDEEGDVIW